MSAFKHRSLVLEETTCFECQDKFPAKLFLFETQFFLDKSKIFSLIFDHCSFHNSNANIINELKSTKAKPS